MGKVYHTDVSAVNSDIETDEQEQSIVGILTEALRGLPVQVGPQGLKFSLETSDDEWKRIVQKIMQVSRQTACFVNFALGDWADGMRSEAHGDKAKLIREWIGEGQYRRVMGCQRVSRKWKQTHRRHDRNVPWSFYKATASRPFDEQMDLMRDFLAKKITLEAITQTKCGKGLNNEELTELISRIQALPTRDREHLLREFRSSESSASVGIHRENTIRDTNDNTEKWYPADTIGDCLPAEISADTSCKSFVVRAETSLPHGTRVQFNGFVRVIIHEDGGKGNVVYYEDGDDYQTPHLMQRDTFNGHPAILPA